MLAVLNCIAAFHAPIATRSARIDTVRMALTFEAAAGVWGLQRNRAENSVKLIANAFGWDTIEVCTRVERKAPGLGIALEELGSDGEAGLVLVESCLEGGNAAAATKPILTGDAIVAVGSVGGPSIAVEAFTYDDTVGVLASLDPEKAVELTLRRLVKLPRVSVTLQFPKDEEREDEQLDLLPGMPLRRSILSRGIKLNDPLARRFDAGWGTGDCGGEGTCCTCALEVAEGLDLLSEQSAQERQMLKLHPTWRLACKASIGELDADSRLVLKVSPRQATDSGPTVVEDDENYDSMAGERPE